MAEEKMPKKGKLPKGALDCGRQSAEEEPPPGNPPRPKAASEKTARPSQAKQAAMEQRGHH